MNDESECCASNVCPSMLFCIVQRFSDMCMYVLSVYLFVFYLYVIIAYLNEKLKTIFFVSTGGIGAKRFCSSKDLGNYCNYVMNKGDRMEYRSCIYTCSTDGCNHSTTMMISRTGLLVSLLMVATVVIAVYS